MHVQTLPAEQSIKFNTTFFINVKRKDPTSSKDDVAMVVAGKKANAPNHDESRIGVPPVHHSGWEESQYS